MRFRTTILLTLLGFTALMTLYYEAYQRSSRESRTAQISGYSRVFGNLLTNNDSDTAVAYAKIIVDQKHYRRLAVAHTDGTLFAFYEGGGEANLFDQILHRIGLIQDRPFTREIIAEDGEVIGWLDGVWINRNVHGYVAVGGPVATVLLLLLFSSRYRLVKEERLITQLRLEEERNERLSSERKLADAQAQFRDLVESANDIIYETNLYGRIQYANPVAEHIMELPRDVLLTKRYTDFVIEDYRPDTVHFYRRQLRKRIANTYLEFPVATGGGQVIWLGQNVRLVMKDDRPVAFQAVARDITNLKKASDEIARRDERLREEMNLAMRIHQALLPIHRPSLVGFDFGLRFEPSSEIGGDFIDVVRFNDPSRIGIVFADITGHGVAAALLSAMLKVLVDEIMSTGRAPYDCFRILNRRLAREYPEGNFASAFYAVFDSTDCSLTYTKASQEPAIVIRRDGTPELLEDGGPALGLLDPDCFGEPVYTDSRVQLRSGDTVFLYTDGLVEIGETDDLFIERSELVDWLLQARMLPPQKLVDQIYEQARARAQGAELSDDVALLAVRVR